MLIEIPDALVKEYQDAKRVFKELNADAVNCRAENIAHADAGEEDLAGKQRRLIILSSHKQYEAERVSSHTLNKIHRTVEEALLKGL